jgi:hypothetical protein
MAHVSHNGLIASHIAHALPTESGRRVTPALEVAHLQTGESHRPSVPRRSGERRFEGALGANDSELAFRRHGPSKVEVNLLVRLRLRRRSFRELRPNGVLRSSPQQMATWHTKIAHLGDAPHPPRLLPYLRDVSWGGGPKTLRAPPRH